MSETLKPCPFCGESDIYVEPEEIGSGGQHVLPYRAGCTSCGAGIRDFHGDTEEDAIALWNRRTPVEHPSAEREALERAHAALRAIDAGPVEYLAGGIYEITVNGRDLLNVRQVIDDLTNLLSIAKVKGER